MNLNQLTLLDLAKTLRACAKKSPHRLQTATLVYHLKKKMIIAIFNNERQDSGIECISHIPWYKTLWGKNLIVMTTHAPSTESIRLFKKRRIQHIYFFEHLNASKSIRMMKHYGITSTRLFLDGR